jgi:hypothetical protein
VCSIKTFRTIARTIRNTINNLENKWKQRDWISVMATLIDYVEYIKSSNTDFSAGAWILSLPESQNENRQEKSIQLNLISILDGKSNITIIPNMTPILKVHQFSRNFLKRFPDSALLGILTLSSLELIQRQLNSQSIYLPPLFKEAANITTENLNTKLEILSSLSWDLDPFLKAEIESLQTQPLEVIESFILKDMLPRIDKDLSPILLKLVADPKKVSLITKFINQFIREFAEEFSRTGAEPILPIQQTAMKIVENVDKVGQSVEEGKIILLLLLIIMAMIIIIYYVLKIVIKDWNQIVLDLRRLTSGDFNFSHVRKFFLSDSYKSSSLNYLQQPSMNSNSLLFNSSKIIRYQRRHQNNFSGGME